METSGLGRDSITIRDVAIHAGVSIATVSRALSRNRPMSPQLQEKVLASVDALGYRPNLVGRALRQKKTSTIGLIVPDLENPFFSALTQEVSRRFSKSGTDVLVISADNSLKLELRAVRAFLGRQVDGLVMIPCDEIESGESVHLASTGVSTLQLDRFVDGVDLSFVGCDNTAGMNLVIKHINEFVDETSHPVIIIGGGGSTSSGRERLQELTFHRPSSLVFDGNFSFDWGRQAAAEILSKGIRSGTIVTTADVIALGVTSALTTTGYSVPKDFRVIGFDDVGVAYLAHPTLTTVSQPLTDMADSIFSFMITNPQSSQHQARRIFWPELVVRESSPALHI
ncbi:MAG: LacI family DNA-binding transcriptional regulator [Candidatus Nanopelagicales bacterium]|nr:LacI family DNA-binding transcriptional regulator [Candidatus Nanopelagicales bacterium]